MEVVRNFDVVKVDEESEYSKDEIVASVTQSFKELKLYKEGKLKDIPAKTLLDEL